MNITEVYERFPEERDCIAYLEVIRWHDTPTCPYCKSTRVTSFKIEQRHHCNSCNTSFSVTVGTIFHHTHLPLQKWFLAVSLILNAKKGIAARQLGRDLNINRNTAWYLAMRIRKAMMEHPQRELLQGIVEMDETYIGGKPRKENKREDDKPHKRGRGTDKTPVVGMKERDGKVVAKVVKKDQLNGKSLSRLVREHVDIEHTTLMTDEYTGYHHISSFMEHKSVNHTVCYVNGEIHTNSIESFWALLKRGLVGQFHKVSIRHLPRYISEFSYRLNNREHAGVFLLTIEKGLGVAK